MSAPAEALRRIAESRATAAPVLDLGDFLLDSLPEELGRLPALRVLALGAMAPRLENGKLKWKKDYSRPNQRFTELNVLKELTGLQTLSLSSCNSLANVDVLSELTGLKALFLDGCTSLMNVDGLKGLSGLQTLYLSGCRALMNVDVLREMTSLRRVDLTQCESLTNVEVLKKLTSLRWLSLRECSSLVNVDMLKELTSLQWLCLSGCKSLVNVDGLKELTGLQNLDLSLCDSVANVDALKELAGLQWLNLTSCGSLANLEALRELTSLQTLKLNRCASLMNVDVLKELTGLQTLELDRCATLVNLDVLKGLTGLRELSLSYCSSLANVDALKELTGLQMLDLRGFLALADVNMLKELTALQKLDLSKCGNLTNVGVLKELTGLQKLDLSECGNLTNVDGLKNLTGLRALNLSWCTSLANVDALKELTGLRTLDLSGCRCITKFGPLRKLLPQLHRLFLHKCDFEDLPAEVCGDLFWDVLDAVRAHFADGDAHGWSVDEELKVFVLGNGGVGKTQLCRRLRDLPYKPEQSTHGIQLGHIDLSLPERATAVRLNLWDFGGQEIYHGSHTLFLQAHAVFIVVWTPNTEDGDYEEGGVKMRHRPLPYWLDYILSVAGTKNPILIVQAKCDTDEDEGPLPFPIPDDFSFLRVLAFSAAQDIDGIKLRAVRSGLVEAAGIVLDRHKAADIPEARVRLTRQLNQMLEDDEKHPSEKRRRLLTTKQFRHLCKTNGKISNWREALRFLHFRGVVFWQPELFHERIILDQSWTLEAIYALFHRAKSLPTLFARGRFTRDLLKELIWQDRSDGEQRTFLGMMESCGICFRARRVNPGHYPREWEYIAPELLPVRASPEVQHQLINLPEAPAPTRAEVRYLFLHEGILRRFLSWLGSHIGDKAVYWRFGCWFHELESRVHVIVDSSWHDDGHHPGQGIITFDVWGEQSVPLLESLITQLKTLSPMQNPQVIQTGFGKHGQFGRRDESDVVPDAIVTRQRAGIGLGRISIPTPGRSVKGAAATRWMGSYVLVNILLAMRPGDAVPQRPLCEALMAETGEDYSPNTVGNYLRSLEKICQGRLFQWPAENRKGNPTILLPDAAKGLNKARQYIESQLDIVLPSWRQYPWADPTGSDNA